MGEVKAPDIPRPEKKFDFMTEERLHELLSILLPHGYSHYDGTFYTGVSPYIGKEHNIITIVANDPNWSGWMYERDFRKMFIEREPDAAKGCVQQLTFF